MDQTMVMILVGVAVVVCVGGVCMAFMKTSTSIAEKRLDDMSTKRRFKNRKGDAAANFLKNQAVDVGGSSFWSKIFPKVDGINALYEQADVGIEFKHFLYIPVGLAIVSAIIGFFLKLPLLIIPVCAASMSVLPFFWLVLRKRKRIKKFTAQMPDALELVGRALRAGHGLASGLHMVAEEMPSPISDEFGRVFEEQNLGIPIEDSLRAMADRVPTMDVRFFTTAVVIQRSTGGDLAEVLDKIGRIIRERFQIMGQVAALTGEGRLSGVVLLAMPPVLLAFTYATNPGYTGVLFSTPIGTKMLVFAGVMQILGAIAIKKIIAIKV